MGQTQPLHAKFLNWVNSSIGSSTKTGFFCNLRHEWAKHVVKQKCGVQVWISYERLVASSLISVHTY
jgi:hypothetical protein